MFRLLFDDVVVESLLYGIRIQRIRFVQGFILALNVDLSITFCCLVITRRQVVVLDCLRYYGAHSYVYQSVNLFYFYMREIAIVFWLRLLNGAFVFSMQDAGRYFRFFYLNLKHVNRFYIRLRTSQWHLHLIIKNAKIETYDYVKETYSKNNA